MRKPYGLHHPSEKLLVADRSHDSGAVVQHVVAFWIGTFKSRTKDDCIKIPVQSIQMVQQIFVAGYLIESCVSVCA